MPEHSSTSQSKSNKGIQTAERASAHDTSDNYVFQRCLFAYKAAQELIHGSVLEIGSGEGYGIQTLAHHASEYTALDKFPVSADLSRFKNVTFIQTEVPPLSRLSDNRFDFVVSFQVIEHIKQDQALIQEIHRVLKPGGKLLMATPNRLTSLTRNPWHIREYTITEFSALMQNLFSTIQPMGVFGNEKVMSYYQKNAAAVKSISRWDVFNLQYRLPAWMLKTPYDLLNRMNRMKLQKADTSLVDSITTADFSLAPATDQCFDLFYIATK